MLKTLTTILIPSIILVGVAVLLLGIKVLFVKGSKFPTDKQEHHRAMRAIQRKRP